MNAKIAKTKQSLLEAFIRLAETTPVDAITVTQLCQEAGINRTTFYRYYSIPMDIIVQKAEELTAQTLYSQDPPLDSTYEFMLRTCKCYYDNRNLMKLYLKAGNSLLPLYSDYMTHRFPAEKIFRDPVRNFLAGGVSGVILGWLHAGSATPPEEVAQYLYDCISKLTDS